VRATGSAARNHVGRYLWQRFLRIFPAFWICLLVTAFGFALLGWHHLHPALISQCGLHCYTSERNGPWGFVFNNIFLKMRQLTIAHTLARSSTVQAWNGSLWSLFFEFVCYLLLAGLAVVGLLRRRSAVAVLTAAAWIATIVITSVPSLNAQFNVYVNNDEMLLLALVPIFLAGSLLYLYRDRIPDSGWLAIASTALFFSGWFLPLGNQYPTFSLTSVSITAPFIAYPMLWLGMHLPFQRIGATNDYSYGIYIYAFPVQQLLAVWGVTHWGYWPYTLLTIAVTAPLAVISWWAVERNALKLKAVKLPRSRDLPDVGANVTPALMEPMAPALPVTRDD
jgi:peptidoglycan/LPS O-acetylase OafA/YrhL